MLLWFFAVCFFPKQIWKETAVCQGPGLTGRAEPPPASSGPGSEGSCGHLAQHRWVRASPAGAQARRGRACVFACV